MTTRYVSNELAFELPAVRASIADRTIHELVVPGRESPCGLTLAVSRTRLQSSLGEAVAHLHDEERRSLGAFEVSSSAVRPIGALEWIDTQVSWKHPNGPVYHRRLHCQLGSLWMSITATAKLDNAAWADQVAEHVVSTLRPRPQEDG